MATWDSWKYSDHSLIVSDEDSFIYQKYVDTVSTGISLKVKFMVSMGKIPFCSSTQQKISLIPLTFLQICPVESSKYYLFEWTIQSPHC